MNQSDILEKSPSLEEMLTQIKKIMSEDMNLEQKKEDIKANPQENDVLELSPTSIIEEAGEQKESEDILQNIDNILDQKKSDEPVMEKVSEPLKQEEVKTVEVKTAATPEPPKKRGRKPKEIVKKVRVASSYATFVKTHYDSVRSLATKDRFKALSELWKKEKEKEKTKVVK